MLKTGSRLLACCEPCVSALRLLFTRTYPFICPQITTDNRTVCFCRFHPEAEFACAEWLGAEWTCKPRGASQPPNLNLAAIEVALIFVFTCIYYLFFKIISRNLAFFNCFLSPLTVFWEMPFTVWRPCFSGNG